MGRSNLHNILDVCSASVRNSLLGLDNFAAQSIQAFAYLESVVDKLGGDCGMGSAWVKKKEGTAEGRKEICEERLQGAIINRIIIIIIIITIITIIKK